MTVKHKPSEEYRKKLFKRHVIEACCIVMACMIIGLSLIYVFDINRSMELVRVMALLGGVMNITLSFRFVVTKEWLSFAGIFLLGVACLCGLSYLTMT